MATIISGTSITYNDGTVQTKAVGQSGATVIQAPGTFAIPSTTTRIKVTCIGGGSGQTELYGALGGSGGTSSFGPYISSTGGTGSAIGSSQGATLQYGADAIGAYGNARPPIPTSLYNTGFTGGHGVRYIDAPFPVTQVPVTVGAGGGGCGGYGSGGAGQPGQGINGGRGGTSVPVPFGNHGGGGGGASGTSAQYQGTGGQGGGAGATAGQPGASPYLGIYGALGGASFGEATNGGTGGYQGIVIVEYF